MVRTERTNTSKTKGSVIAPFPANYFSHNEDSISVENDKSKEVNGLLFKVVVKSSNREELCSFSVLVFCPKIKKKKH